MYRGQTKHYHETGKPSVITSFQREGCIPPQMMKWTRYAEEVLKYYFKIESPKLEFVQALLQHYGWRSFFVDCTENPAVAAWFASHSYLENPGGGLSEDYQERPVHLKKRSARFDVEDGEGHVYIFSRKKTDQIAGLTNLAELQLESFRTRPQVQSAWLIGPLGLGGVPSDCFVAHLTASREILRKFAREEGLNKAHDLFPPQREDPIFRNLLSLPWKSVGTLGPGPAAISVFSRSLDLPEYEDTWVKIASENVAFYRGTSIGQTFPTIQGEREGTTIQVPDVVIYGAADLPTPLNFPKVVGLLKTYENLAFEVDDLIQHASMAATFRYQKGLGVLTWEPSLVVICELLVDHPGLDTERVSFAKGWFYRVDEDGVWEREPHPEECGCSDDLVHERLLASLQIIESSDVSIGSETLL